MPDETVPAKAGNGLLDRFSNQQLGEVTRPGRGAEDLPGEVQQRGAETGRRPEGLIPQREVVEQQVRNDEDDTEKLLQERYKVRTGYDADGVAIQEDLTLEEIARRKLMARIVNSANQLPNVSRKNAELQAIVEKVAVEKAAPVSTPAKPAPPTQEQIYNAFLPMLQEFVKLGHVEGDLAEAYPQALTGAMYNTARLNTMEETLLWVVEWIKVEKEKRDNAATHAHVNAVIDKVAAMADGDDGDKFYAGLKDPVKREAFVAWLRKDIDPKVGSITPESIQNHWVTFNAKDLLQLTKEAAAKAAKPDPNPTRKRAGADGPGARPGKIETPAAPSMLDRMTDYRLGDQQ